MNVVDSSGWIEYFHRRANSPYFRGVIDDTDRLLVPTICIAEVARHLTRAISRDAAEVAAAQMRRASVIDLDADLAVFAARMSLKHNLPLADAIVYATAQTHEATLFTQDADFAKL